MTGPECEGVAGDDGDFHATALEVLCRVFEDGADARHDKWLDWYDPTKWLHPSRALGAFISLELKPEREALAGTLGQLSDLRARLAQAEGELADANAHIAHAAEAYSAAIRERNVAQAAEDVARAYDELLGSYRIAFDTGINERQRADAAEAELANKREAVELLAGALQHAEAIAAVARAYVAARAAVPFSRAEIEYDALVAAVEGKP